MLGAMKYLGGFAIALALSGCGNFFEELPLGDGSTETESSTTSGAATGTATGTGLDCNQALSDCASQDRLMACEGEPRVPRGQDCAQTCGAVTAVTCYAAADLSSHGCWCEQTGPVNQFGCAGVSQCVARCGGPELNSTCVHACFARNNAVAARLYGALVFCAQNDCKSLCKNNPAQCASCMQKTMTGALGGCAALSAACSQDRGEQGGVSF